MTEYSAQIDQQIAQLLQTRQMVSPAMIPGLTEAEGLAFLQHYAQIHPEAASFDGTTLVVVDPASAPADPVSADPGATEGSSFQPPPPVPGLGAQDPVGVEDLPPGAEGTYAAPTAGYGAPLNEVPIDAMTEFQREPTPKWPWVLPVLWGIVGGIIAWLIVREKDADTGRNMLILGGALTALQLCAVFGLAACAGGFSGATVTDTAWPATGRSTFYYFGTPT